MKKIVFTLTSALVFVACVSQEVEVPEQKEKSIKSKIVDEEVEVAQFDSVKAAAYDADDYGMHQYVMAFLKAGPNRDLDSATTYDLQRGHLDNIKRMAEEGTLVLAGPFMHDGELRGIYIFDVKTLEDAKALTETDPAIQAGSLVMELIPWYGSAALKGVNSEHKKIAKVKF